VEEAVLPDADVATGVLVTVDKIGDVRVDEGVLVDTDVAVAPTEVCVLVLDVVIAADVGARVVDDIGLISSSSSKNIPLHVVVLQQNVHAFLSCTHCLISVILAHSKST